MIKIISRIILFVLLASYLTVQPSASAGLLVNHDLSEITYNNKYYISLGELARFCKMKASSTGPNQISLRGSGYSLKFEVNSRKIFFNGLMLWLHMPVVKSSGQFLVAEADYLAVIAPLLQEESALDTQKCQIIVLDPGHGGRDQGTVSGRGIEEKRLTLDIAQRARAILANAGLTVYLTRDADRYVELEDRNQIAAIRRADVFVSIHLNAGKTTDVLGQETYITTAPYFTSTNEEHPRWITRLYYRNNRLDSANAILGYYLHKSLMTKLERPDRGLRRARFSVLKNSHCPAALVECAFLSHKGEAAALANPSFRQAVANAIANGIMDYVAAVKRARLSSN